MQERKRVESRKAAYGWIKSLFGIPESVQDEITVLADALGGQFGLKDNLRALRDGTSDPSSQLIDALKNKSMIGKQIPQEAIEANLLDPFKDC